MPDHIQRIGIALREQCPPEAKRHLLYAEVEDGVIASAVFFQMDGEIAHFRYPSAKLEDLVYEFWETGNESIPARSWRAIEYSLIGVKFDISLAYAEQFIPHEGQHDRRPRVLQRHFPGLALNFDNPEG
jgi:hypothetical protein